MSPDSFPFLYGITDSTLMPESILFSKAELALKSGLSLLQYRNKSARAQQREHEASTLLALCERYSASLIVNDDIELAKKIGAAGVHLGQEDASIEYARVLLGDKAIIGATCHDSLALAKLALEQGATYLAFGRFFSSKTKSNAKAADLSVLQEARRMLACPIVAIGGIDTENAQQVWQTGAHCVAVCHSLFAPAQPGNVIKKFESSFLHAQKFQQEFA